MNNILASHLYIILWRATSEVIQQWLNEWKVSIFYVLFLLFIFPKLLFQRLSNYYFKDYQNNYSFESRNNIPKLVDQMAMKLEINCKIGKQTKVLSLENLGNYFLNKPCITGE